MVRISKLGRLLLTLSLVAGCFALTPKMQAQQESVTARVPFAFTANNQQFPAGLYEIRALNSFLLRVSNVATHQSEYLMVSPSGLREIPSYGRLIFHRYGNGSEHYLNQIWMPGRSEVSELNPTKRERQALIAAKSAQPSGNVVEALVTPVR
jgi:hypothetical protein